MDQQPINRPRIPIEVLQRLKIYLSNTANLIQLQDLDPSTLFTTAEVASDKMCLISELFATNIQEKGNFNLAPIYDLHREEHLQLLNKINFSIHLKLQALQTEILRKDDNDHHPVIKPLNWKQSSSEEPKIFRQLLKSTEGERYIHNQQKHFHCLVNWLKQHAELKKKKNT